MTLATINSEAEEGQLKKLIEKTGKIIQILTVSRWLYYEKCNMSLAYVFRFKK